MGMNSRILAIIAGAAIVAGIAVTAAFGAHRADPGISASTITIGGTFPLTGPASLYKTIPTAEKAYFDYVNDNGGINGQIPASALRRSQSAARSRSPGRRRCTRRFQQQRRRISTTSTTTAASTGGRSTFTSSTT